jgi:hypothetical protein
MSRLIASIISGSSRPHFPFVVLESSLVQSCLPVLRAFVNGGGDTTTRTTDVLLFSLLYQPSTLAGVPHRQGLCVVDRTAEVPGYGETPSTDLAEFVLNRVKQGKLRPYDPRLTLTNSDSPGWTLDGRHGLGRRPVLRPRIAVKVIRPHSRSPLHRISSSQ